MATDVQHSGGSPYYTLSEVAKLLGVHYETAARWVRTAKLEGVKLSRRKVLIPRARCEVLLAGRSGERAHQPQFGSVQHWLRLIGTLTPKEAARLRASAEDFEKVEEEG